jgi:hypothetical protein
MEMQFSVAVACYYSLGKLYPSLNFTIAFGKELYILWARKPISFSVMGKFS